MMQPSKLPVKQTAHPILSGRVSGAVSTGLIARPLTSEVASSLIELALVLPVLFLLLLGVFDFGRGYYLAIEISQAAHNAALYGSQNPTDTTGMQYAAVADAVDVPNFTISSVIATYGCECSDGSLPVASCTTNPSCGSMNVVDYVQVNTSASYSALFPYPGIPSPLTLHGSARMRAGQ
jgi:Flp pilus assembly protein TadG